jgi:AcrR family transcriptional regulator
MTKKAKLSVVTASGTPDSATGQAVPQDSRKKASKQQAILREAAAMFNDNGVGAVGFGDLAKRMGVGRASFYHYVADREDLIFRCFQQSCEMETERLDAACEESRGLPQVLQYLRLSLSPEANQTAIITETGLLSEGSRSIIHKARRRNFERLAEMIGDGIDAGNIRPCDEQIIARVLPSIIAFARMSYRWVAKDRGNIQADAIVDFIEYGSAANPEKVEFRLDKDVDDFLQLSVAGFDKQSITDLKIEQILRKASQLLNLHGTDNVSLEDVASALGVTRGAFYHYFNDREDLVRRCLDRSYDLYGAFIDYAIEHGRNGLEKAAIVSHLNTQAQVGTLQPVAGWMGFDVLSPNERRKARQKMRALLKRSDALAEEGLEDGSRRNHDYKAVTIARAGAYLWIPKWISEIEHPTPHRVADEVVALFNCGLTSISER